MTERFVFVVWTGITPVLTPIMGPIADARSASRGYVLFSLCSGMQIHALGRETVISTVSYPLWDVQSEYQQKQRPVLPEE